MEKYRLLRINLSEGLVKEEIIPPELIHKYAGGKGLGAYYLYKELRAKTDPLGPDNKLIFMAGPLTGIMPSCTRYAVVTKSPLTGAYADSFSGGNFSYELRKAGYLGIIIEGKSPNLVVLKIEGQSVTLEDVCSTLKGKSTTETSEYYPGFSVASIGPGGENLVKFACILNNVTGSGRPGAAGRCGVGAVMGSKNLKAIAIKSNGKLEIPEITKELQRKHFKRLADNKDLREFFSGGMFTPNIDMCDEAHIVPTRNFTAGSFDQVRNINEAALRPHVIKKSSCHLCPIGCGNTVRVNEGPFAGTEATVSYEPVVLLGANCGQGDLSTVLESIRLANEYGLDVMSLGDVIAFAMECSEKGLIDYEIHFGDSGKQVELVKMIATREGIGDLLAEGVKMASVKIAKGSGDFAIHVKGLEFPGYDPRGSRGMALAYATSDRGSCHQRAYPTAAEVLDKTADPFTTTGKAALVKRLQDYNAAAWSLITCDCVPYSAEWLAEVLTSLGLDADEKGFMTLGERVYNVTRLFNVREGLSRKDDTLPGRFTEPMKDTGWRIPVEDFERMLDEYYELRGWDRKTGIPKLEKIRELGVEELAPQKKSG